MNVFEGFEHKSALVTVILSAPAGVALFFLVRLLESLGRLPMPVNVLFEEAVKIILFVGGALALRSRSWNKIPAFHEAGGDGGRSAAVLLPVLCIAAFAVTENLLYFLNFPTSSIYRRLLYSYPIHLNTALFYALAFLSGSTLRVGLYFLIGFLYHLGLNHLSLHLQAAAVYAVGVGNFVVLLLLYWRVRMKLAQRSISSCWNPR
jgi:hypothetical protein